MKLAQWLCVSGLMLMVGVGCGPTLEEQRQKAEASYKIGAAEMKTGNYSEAIKFLKDAQKYNPNDAKIYNALGLIHVEYKEYGEAISMFEKAIRLDPNLPDAHNSLGTVYARLERWDSAIIEFKKALSDPSYQTPALAHYNLGLALMEKGDNINAVKEFHEAVELYPKFSRALNQYGIALYRMNRNQEATKRFKQTIEIAPDFIDPYVNLGLVYMKQGKRDDAIAQFKSVLERSVDDKIRTDVERYLEMLE